MSHFNHVPSGFTLRRDAISRYPTAVKGCAGFVFTHGIVMGSSSDAARRSLSGMYLGNREVLITGRDIRCATSWYNLDFTFDLAVMTVVTGLYLRNRKVQEVALGRDID